MQVSAGFFAPGVQEKVAAAGGECSYDKKTAVLKFSHALHQLREQVKERLAAGARPPPPPTEAAAPQ